MVELIEHGDLPLDANTVFLLVIEENATELAEMTRRVRDIVQLGADKVARRREGERLVRERASRRMRRWDARHPEVAPPEPWDSGTPGYIESERRWRTWRTAADRRWFAVRSEGPYPPD